MSKEAREGNRIFTTIALGLVGLLVLGLIAIGASIWAVRTGYLPPSPTPEPELTPQERFAAEFWKGEITVAAKLIEAKTFCPFFAEPCSEPFIAEFDWAVEGHDGYPSIRYSTITKNPDFITVLERLVANSEDYRGLEFTVTLSQEYYHLLHPGASTIYVDGTLLGIERDAEDGYRIWEPFTFQPSLELIEEVLEGTTIDDPQLADWQRLELKTIKEAYSAMVEYAQQGRLSRAFNLRVKITQAILDRTLRDASVIPLCHGPYRCDYKILERNEDNSLKLYLIEDREMAEEAVRTLRYHYQEVANLIEKVEILSLTDYDEELNVNWAVYNLAIQVTWDGKYEVWFSIQPGKNIEVIHWIF